MGVFQEMVEVVNRTSRPLNLRYDGQDMNIPPNYDEDGNPIDGVHTMIPRQCIPFVLGQNPVMGSEEAEDPSAFESLVGIIDPKKNPKKRHSWYNCEFIPAEEEGIGNMTRVNVERMLEGELKPGEKILVRGRRVDQIRPIGDKNAFDVREGDR